MAGDELPGRRWVAVLHDILPRATNLGAGSLEAKYVATGLSRKDEVRLGVPVERRIGQVGSQFKIDFLNFVSQWEFSAIAKDEVNEVAVFAFTSARGKIADPTDNVLHPESVLNGIKPHIGLGLNLASIFFQIEKAQQLGYQKSDDECR
jgi:hypothetical protein